MTEAVKQAELYCLEEVVENYDESDYENFFTPKSTDDGPIICESDQFVGDVIEGAKEMQLCSWSGGTLHDCEIVPAIEIDGRWFVLIVDSGDYDWL